MTGTFAVEVVDGQAAAVGVHLYLRIVEILERIPRLERVTLGQRIMEKCRLEYEEQGPRHFGWLLSGGQLAFVSDPGERHRRVDWLKPYALALLTKAVEDGAGESFFTLGVATEPYPNEGRSHDFVYLSGGFRLTEDERRRRDEFLEDNIGPPRDVDTAVLARLDAGLDDGADRDTSGDGPA